MNIIIAGMTCSGKTTLSNQIKDTYSDSTIFREDDYMKDLKDIPKRRGSYLLDLPSAYHLDEFTHDTKTLLTTGTTYYPTYDAKRNTRQSKELLVSSNRINVFEGLHTIDILKEISDSLKIFIDTPPEVCKKRRIVRDTKLYNISSEDITRYFDEIIMSIYRTHILPQKEIADIIIRGEGDHKCLLKTLHKL